MVLVTGEKVPDLRASAYVVDTRAVCASAYIAGEGNTFGLGVTAVVGSLVQHIDGADNAIRQERILLIVGVAGLAFLRLGFSEYQQRVPRRFTRCLFSSGVRDAIRR